MLKSNAALLASLPEVERRAFLDGLSDNALAAMPWLWNLWANPVHQVAPAGDWQVWVIMGGRGAGKTRAGAEWVRARVEGPTPLARGAARRVALLGETLEQVRDVMVEGESGLLACCPTDRAPEFKRSLGRLVWPNGAEAMVLSASNPEALRGPQFDCAWSDELAKWKYGREAWDMLQFTLRLGDDPRQSVYSLLYLTSNVEGGEYYDYYYADDEARAAQMRSPITDGVAGEPWVFRPKDIRGWWSNPHHNRIGGVREASPTAWLPGSKPVWLTETGCPAIDLGANMPNLFYDPKSSESGVPFGSVGARDDEMQRRFLQAKLDYWQTPGNNPFSAIYGGPMIPDDGVFVWTWDTRPFPDFPVRESVWSDSPLYDFGHWLTGRVSSSSLAEVVADICRARGVTAFDVSGLFGTVDGYVIDTTQSARQALQPLMLAYAFDAFEAEDRIVFRMRDLRPAEEIAAADLVASDEPANGPVLRERTSAGEAVDAVRVTYVEAESDYRIGAVEVRHNATTANRTTETSLPLALSGPRARLMAQRWLAEAMRSDETVELSLPPSHLALEPGDLITLEGSAAPYRIDTIVDGSAREVTAARIERSLYVPAAVIQDNRETELPVVPGPVEAVFLDLPVLNAANEAEAAFAVTADPWPGDAAIYGAAQQQGFELVGETRQPALIGELAGDLAPGLPDRWQRVSVEILLPGAGIASTDRLSVLNGANVAALKRSDGEWEVIQFQQAELVAPGRYRLGMLLRGQRGTGALGAETLIAGTRIVILNNALARLTLGAGERGLTRYYRVGPSRFGFAHPSFVESVETFCGTALRPFAPARIMQFGRLGGEVVLRWIRQTRINGDSWETVEVPLGEEAEAYRLRVLSGATILREEALTGAAFTYTAAMQAADGVAVGDEIAVAQLSNAFGYGPEKRITING
ncbi:glycoside hydrolase TIM-barrel-like domain-containing protein [Rhodobacteraceae bacterium NNCM2]|nr:glycoside hydrolase TIM-barrel-like domain-containing protein [Coraliihabitans acroporae]